MKLVNPEIRFEVTNRCNALCIMCPREKMKRPQGVLDMELYKRVLKEAKDGGATQVSLENYGEPFMDPFMVERIKYAKKMGFWVFTITNGSFLTKDTAKEIILAGLDKLRISVYGITKEVYEAIHKGLKFEQVLENVNNLFRTRKALGRKNPRIEMYFLLLDENKHQMDAFRKKWESLADDISIWKPHNWSDGRDYRKRMPSKKTCGRPFTGPVQVQWDGFVVPCCYDYDSRIILGDLNKETLDEVLSNTKYNAFREAHKNGEFWKFPFCDMCDQLTKRDDVLIYTTIKTSKVGASNTNYLDLTNGGEQKCRRDQYEGIKNKA